MRAAAVVGRRASLSSPGAAPEPGRIDGAVAGVSSGWGARRSSATFG
jgi:hypothetical protein